MDAFKPPCVPSSCSVCHSPEPCGQSSSPVLSPLKPSALHLSSFAVPYHPKPEYFMVHDMLIPPLGLFCLLSGIAASVYPQNRSYLLLPCHPIISSSCSLASAAAYGVPVAYLPFLFLPASCQVRHATSGVTVAVCRVLYAASADSTVGIWRLPQRSSDMLLKLRPVQELKVGLYCYRGLGQGEMDKVRYPAQLNDQCL